jgi:hypothetical protein
MKRLSPTLLDSFAYYLSVDEEQSADKRQELLNRLNGVKLPPNEAMQRGIDFENAVIAACNGKYEFSSEKYDLCVKEVSEIVQGGFSQYPVFLEIAGVRIDGFIDFLKLNTIFDVKTTSKYEVGKYQFNNQHLVYLLALRQEKINRFVYLATDLSNVYPEEYFFHPDMENQLRSNVIAFLDYLTNDYEMQEAYKIYCEREVKQCSTIQTI